MKPVFKVIFKNRGHVMFARPCVALVRLANGDILLVFLPDINVLFEEMLFAFSLAR